MTLPMPPEPKTAYFIQIGPFDDAKVSRECIDRIVEALKDELCSVVLSKAYIENIYGHVAVQLESGRRSVYPEMANLLLLKEMKELAKKADSIPILAADGVQRRLQISEQIASIGEKINKKYLHDNDLRLL